MPFSRYLFEGEISHAAPRPSSFGIGFYRDLDGQQLWTSTAQMFDERGRGLVPRGTRAQTETRGRQRHPYLTANDAEHWLSNQSPH
jgi:hypothetical protein